MKKRTKKRIIDYQTNKEEDITKINEIKNCFKITLAIKDLKKKQKAGDYLDMLINDLK